MARLRFDNLFGTLGASLSSGGTTMTFAVAPTYADGAVLPAIASPDYLPISIDENTSSYERAWITAYAGGGATTATISRGQEGTGAPGTSGSTHSNAANWMAAPGAVDFSGENVNTVASSGAGTVTIPDPFSPPDLYTISDVTLTGNPTFAFPTAAAGKSFTIILRQDGTGGRTATWPTVTWLGGAGAPVLSTTASAIDVVTFVCTDGTHWLGAFTPGYSSVPASPDIQNGVFLPGDLALSAISINTGTGALTFTPAATGTQSAWVANASGVLVPVGYLGGAQTLTPSLPATTKYAVIGVEIDTAGNVTLVKGTDTATQLNTGVLISSNSPATSSGKMRIADFALWNNAGTINFSDHTTTPTVGVNWIDRRPWIRGARYRYDRSAGNYTTASTSSVSIDSTNFKARIECTGVPIKIKLLAATFGLTSSSYISIFLWQDGIELNIVDFLVTSGVFNAPNIEFEVTPSQGSHLFELQWGVGAGTATLYGSGANISSLLIEETIRQNSANGHA